MSIRLADIWPIATPENYKLHFARWNGENQPLEVWARDKQEWQGWQEYRPARDDFNRTFIFSLVQFYHEPDIWLFGGVFRVLARHADRYEVELTKEGEGFLGRLKLRSTYRERATRVKFENHYPGFEIQEILREPYSGRSFPGFEVALLRAEFRLLACQSLHCKTVNRGFNQQRGEFIGVVSCNAHMPVHHIAAWRGPQR